MKPGKTGLRLLALLVVIPMLAGCWDRKEINDLAIVQITSFDKVEDQYRMSVSFPLVGQMGGLQGGGGGTGGAENQTNYVESGTSPSLHDALMNLQRKLSRTLYDPHRRVLLIGEEAAKEGISDILDIIPRLPENRLRTYLLVTKGPALKVITTAVKVERISGEMFREIIVNLMVRPVTVKDFIHAILAEGVDPYTVVFERAKTETGQSKMTTDTIQICGLALFRNDKLAGIMEGPVLNGALLVLNQSRRPVLSVKMPRTNGVVSVQFTELITRVEPIVEGENIRMRIHVNGIYEIDVNQTDIPLVNIEKDNMIKESVNREIKDQILSAVNQMQTVYRSDAIGFGNALRHKFPKVWKKVGPRWRDIYPEVPVEVSLDLRMEHVGSINRPITRHSGS